MQTAVLEEAGADVMEDWYVLPYVCLNHHTL
jgi:hypothetical protein